MAPTMMELLDDLLAETRVTKDMVAPLDADGWERDTPAPGWRIRDQVSHLAYFDESTILAATEPERFHAEAQAMAGREDTFADEVAKQSRELAPRRVLQWFRTARRQLVESFTDLHPAARVPWYGPDMSAASMVTARIMETWAHGQDIADTLGIERDRTGRLRHIAHLGVATFGFAYTVHGREAPDTPVRIELAAGDTTWSWGPDDAQNRVTGPALDFCLLVTQRRHRADTALSATGEVADEWLSLAQAFAGPPGPGRAPLQEVT